MLVILIFYQTQINSSLGNWILNRTSVSFVVSYSNIKCFYYLYVVGHYLALMNIMASGSGKWTNKAKKKLFQTRWSVVWYLCATCRKWQYETFSPSLIKLKNNYCRNKLGHYLVTDNIPITSLIAIVPFIEVYSYHKYL